MMNNNQAMDSSTTSSSTSVIRNINSKIFIFNNGIDHAPTQVRRMMIQFGQCSLDKFIRDINETYHEKIVAGEYVMRYQDEENDWIDFSTELEWTSALHVCVSGEIKLFKIRFIPKTVHSHATQPSHRYSPYATVHGGNRNQRNRTFNETLNVPQFPEFIKMLRDQFMIGGNLESEKQLPLDSENGPHYGTVCDGCECKDWIGKRYKCHECENFDLCEECYNNSSIRDQHFNGTHAFDVQILPKVPELVDDNTNLQLLTQSFNRALSTSEQPPASRTYEKELAMLMEMGFQNVEENLTVLQKAEGDVQKAIVELLNRQQVSNTLYI